MRDGVGDSVGDSVGDRNHNYISLVLPCRRIIFY